jgi:hypothetical protein
MRALAQRQLANYTRNPGNALARMMVGFGLGTLVGAVFFKMEVTAAGPFVQFFGLWKLKIEK